MHFSAQLKKFCAYLLGKKAELKDLDSKDIVMTKTILDIHRTRTHKEFVLVPLFAIKPIHRIDRETALEAMAKRVQSLAACKDELLAARTITCAILAEHLPSVSWIKVVQENPDSYLAYEGNGRVEAMQQVFRPEDEIWVEVEQYHFHNPTKILSQLNTVRRLNGLLA